MERRPQQPDSGAEACATDSLSSASQPSHQRDLELETVLQYVVDSARILTGARYSAITTVDGSGQREEFITSGMTPEERQWMLDARRARFCGSTSSH